MKVGDLVKVQYSYEHLDSEDYDYDWVGICTWTCGYKYTFALITGGEETWTISDLEVAGARVISESC